MISNTLLFETTLAGLLIIAAEAAQTAPGNLIQPRKGEVPASGLYVPVSLERYATGHLGISFPAKSVTVRGIPFDLVSRPDADHFPLKSAQWIDWKEDPSSYYAAYDSGPETPGDPRMPMFKIPVADYQAVYLLASTEEDPALSPIVSFRIGVYGGPRRTVQHDFSATIPRASETRGPNIMATIPTLKGNLFLVRVPVGLAFAQDFKEEWALDVEVTKELRLAIRRPDPCRFQIRPLGPPSGVRIFGMTFARSPVQMEVTTDEAGHIFNEPQVPTFHVRLHNVSGRRMTVSLEAVATDYYGQTTAVASDEIALAPGAQASHDLAVRVPRRGYHDLVIFLRSGRETLLRRETTFALLPPDTRKYRHESPFGVWDFCGGHYTPNEADVVGPLYVKAGLRYGMFSFSAQERAKYGVLAGNEPTSPDVLAKRLEEDPLFPKRVLIFHEHAISGAHIMRPPDLFTGRSPYRLDEKEQQRFNELWQQALETARTTRQRFPDAHLAFGNGAPQLLEEFLRHKFPKELFDSRGNECGSFMRPPEAQPLDFVANNAGLWMDRQILDHYGYREKPITQCYEVCYPSTNPGNLSPRTQAAYLIRHAMHSLAWGVPIFRPALIVDVGNSYYFSNWGASGLCYGKPDVRPKPSYVAIATMTQVLDGARFVRAVPTGSTTVYAVEFHRRDGNTATVLWTPRGKRGITLLAPGLSVGTLTDIMGNDRPLAFSEGRGEVEITAEPIFLTTEKPLERVIPGPTTLPSRPTGRSFRISSLASLAEWKVESGRNRLLEWHNYDAPRRKGDFLFREVASFEGEANVLEVRPRLPVPGSPYLPMYAVLVHTTGVEIPGQPTEIGLLVNGNGGWGRILFELEDASGQRWTSIGCAQSKTPTRWMADWMSPEDFAAMKTQPIADWNTNDAWRRSSINFEGWGYLKFPLPGNYPGEGYHWPYSSQWHFTGEGVVHYPLRFTKLILEVPEKVLYLTEYIPAPRPSIYLKDLQVTYEPPEKAFVAE